MDIILGLDVSTACIGVCIFKDNGEDGEILRLTHIVPKCPKNITGIESLFIKKKNFMENIVAECKQFGITKVVIEEPLLGSNNVNTGSTLLRFNGMISDCIYELLHIVPEYISSYDARKYSFPVLMGIRTFNKKGIQYPAKKLIKEIKDNKFSLFADYAWDIDKKFVMWSLISNIYSGINWLYNSKNKLKKENFDATDALVTCLALAHKNRYGELVMASSDIQDNETSISYTVSFWGREEKRIIKLAKS